MTQKGKSRNVLASPLGEEGHEVAKGWMVVRMIMTLDMDVTAERRHYNTHRPQGDTTTLGAKGPVKLTNPPAVRPVNPKNPHAEGVSKGASNSLLRISLFFSTIKRKQA